MKFFRGRAEKCRTDAGEWQKHLPRGASLERGAIFCFAPAQPPSRCEFVSRARRRRALGVFNDNNYSIAARQEMQKVAWSEGNLQPRLYSPSRRGIYCSSHIKKNALNGQGANIFRGNRKMRRWGTRVITVVNYSLRGHIS